MAPSRLLLLLSWVSTSVSASCVIKIAQFGDFSGPLRTFGPNTFGVAKAAEIKINAEGGVTLADGTSCTFEVEPYDSGCSFTRALSVVKRLAGADFLVGVGPTCSGAAQPLFGQMQYKAGGAEDVCVATKGWNAGAATIGTDSASDSRSPSGDGYDPSAMCLQFPIFTDTSIRPGLAARSDWTFRQVPNEATMYDVLWEWVAEYHCPECKTLFMADEGSNAHSWITARAVIRTKANKWGLSTLCNPNWATGRAIELGAGAYTCDNPTATPPVCNNDAGRSLCGFTDFGYQSTFSGEADDIIAANADVLVIAAHPFTLCGMAKELVKRRYRPRLLIGLTSSAATATQQGCLQEVQSIIIPTSFAPINDLAKTVAADSLPHGGQADLHSAAAWEILHIVRDIINDPANSIEAKPTTVASDRHKMRLALANLSSALNPLHPMVTEGGQQWDIPSGDTGILGPAMRTTTGESSKPFLFVQMKGLGWDPIFPPAGEPLIYDTLANYSHIPPSALQPVGAWAARPDPAAAAAITARACVAADGSAGVLDCSGACLADADCAMADAEGGYTTCAQMYRDSFCDDGTFPTDARSYPNWNCPAYACDNSACASCGADGPYGTCGTDYTCSNGGSCGASGCVCTAGYSGFACEVGVGVCPDDFACAGASGACVGGVCACGEGTSGHDCSVALSTQLPHVEVEALTDLFHATGGYGWLHRTGWLSSTDPCEGSWAEGYHGVLCGGAPRRVREIWLSSNKLVGQLPASLSQLSSLRFLGLEGNGLSGFLTYALSELLANKDIELRLWNNRIYCPVPLALLPAVGTCVDAGLSLSAVAPASALAFAGASVTLSGDLKGGAATLAAYPELRVRMTKPDGASVDLIPSGAEGADALSVVLPEVSGAMDVTLSLYHGAEAVGSGGVAFSFYGCGVGEFKSLEGDAIACAQCPADTFCVNNRKFDCPPLTSAPPGSVACVASGCTSADAAYNVSACDEGTERRAVRYYWKAEAAACNASLLPADTSLACDYVPLSADAAVGLLAVGVVMALLVMLPTWLLLQFHPKTPTMIKGQRPLVAVIMLGSIGSSFTVLVEAGAPSDALCALRPALLYTWFITMYGMELLIALRMQLIFINRSMKNRRVSTGAMLRRFAALFAAHAAVLAIWFGVDRPKATVQVREHTGIGPVEHTVCATENDAFVTLHIFFGGAIALWSVYIAVSLRNIRAEFNESASIGVSMAVLCVCALVAMPLVLSSNDATMVLVVKVAAVYVSVLGSVGVLYTRMAIKTVFGFGTVVPVSQAGTLATGGATSTSVDDSLVSTEEKEELAKLNKQKSVLIEKIDELEKALEQD